MLVRTHWCQEAQKKRPAHRFWANTDKHLGTTESPDVCPQNWSNGVLPRLCCWLIHVTLDFITASSGSLSVKCESLAYVVSQEFSGSTSHSASAECLFLPFPRLLLFSLIASPPQTPHCLTSPSDYSFSPLRDNSLNYLRIIPPAAKTISKMQTRGCWLTRHWLHMCCHYTWRPSPRCWARELAFHMFCGSQRRKRDTTLKPPPLSLLKCENMHGPCIWVTYHLKYISTQILSVYHSAE